MRKHLLTIFVLLLAVSGVAQTNKEIKVSTEASEVTVFIDGAQVLRKKSINLPVGKTTLRFSNLSPYIDAKSVRLKASGEVMVLSVNHQMNYLDSLKNGAKSEVNYAKQIEALNENIVLENANKEVIQAELAFLNENSKIGGSNTGVSLTSLRETANYYRERISSLKMKDIELQKKITKLTSERDVLAYQQRTQGETVRTPIGEVLATVECKRPVTCNFELTYYVANASWFPTYDIRAESVDEPIQLIYKANVRQSTKENWKNVQLKISSGNPTQGNIAPQLKTYYLNYHVSAPRYDVNVGDGSIKGIIRDNMGEPLIGASALVPGTTIGTVADVNGQFSLSVPPNTQTLEFAYIGYKKKQQQVSAYMNVVLEEDSRQLDEVVVVGYGAAKKSQVTGSTSVPESRIRGVSLTNSKNEIRGDIALPTMQHERQTAIEFEIKIPYTINSDNKTTVVEVDRYSLPADYEYFCIPKLNKDVFLLANIVDWEKYNLLEGEANIFFENTFVGKTVLDLRSVSDTLNLSLGRDKSLSVKREKVKDSNTKKFLGNKREEVRAWKISARNNKKKAVELTILDQVPVSSNPEIEVVTEKLSKGTLNEETGEIKWKINLKPSTSKDIELEYKVKYPKNRSLAIE